MEQLNNISYKFFNTIQFLEHIFTKIRIKIEGKQKQNKKFTRAQCNKRCTLCSGCSAQTVFLVIDKLQYFFRSFLFSPSIFMCFFFSVSLSFPVTVTAVKRHTY